MRLFVPLVLVLLVAGIIFLATNAEEQVDVNLGTKTYSEVPLGVVVFVSFAIGAGVVAVTALVEGATIRLANRRLRRELRQAETEIHFLRTGPPAASRPEPDQAGPFVVPPLLPAETEEPPELLPSAPVYDDSEDETDPYRSD
jgi:uncharacterized integral membrane protein